MIHVSDRLQLLLSGLASQGIRIIATLFLLRILNPAQFGQVELVVSFTGLFASLGDFGLRRILVQKRDFPEEQIRDTLFILLLGTGTLLLIINVTCGLFLAARNGDWVYFWLAASFGMTALLSAIHDTQLSLLARRLAFGAEVRQNLLIATVQASSGIAFAFAGFGVYTLALQPLVAQVIANINIQRYEPVRWPRHFRGAVARSCIRPGLQLAAAYYFAVVASPIQKLLIFRASGKDLEILGLFGRLFQLRDMVVFNLINSFERLIFPLLSAHQHDPARLRDLFLRGAAALTTFVSFCGWGLAITSPELVNVLAGPQWAAIQNAHWLRVLCVPLMTTLGAGSAALFLCTALNRTYIWSAHSLVIVILSGLGLVTVWLNAGLTALAMVFAIAQVVASLAVTIWALWTLNLKAGVLLARLAAPLFIGLAAGLVTYVTKRFLFPLGPDWQRLLVSGLMFTAIYIALSWKLDPGNMSELRRLVRRRPAQPIDGEV